jgi:hypothetical protein
MVTKNGYELVLGSIFKYTASLNTGGHAVDTLTGFLIKWTSLLGQSADLPVAVGPQDLLC